MELAVLSIRSMRDSASLVIVSEDQFKLHPHAIRHTVESLFKASGIPEKSDSVTWATRNPRPPIFMERFTEKPMWTPYQDCETEQRAIHYEQSKRIPFQRLIFHKNRFDTT